MPLSFIQLQHKWHDYTFPYCLRFLQLKCASEYRSVMPYDMLEVQLNLVIKMVRYVVVLVLLSGSMKD